MKIIKVIFKENQSGYDKELSIAQLNMADFQEAAKLLPDNDMKAFLESLHIENEDRVLENLRSGKAVFVL